MSEGRCWTEGRVEQTKQFPTVNSVGRLFLAYFMRFFSLESTHGGTKAAAWDNLCRAMSLTKDEEVTNWSWLGIKTTVSIFGAMRRLAWARSNSNSKSLNFRSPRIIAIAPCLSANSTVRPSSTATFILLMDLVASRAISSLSSNENQGFLESLGATAKMTRSNNLEPRLSTSRCPSVIGSKVPGYTAIRSLLAIVFLLRVSFISEHYHRKPACSFFAKSPIF